MDKAATKEDLRQLSVQIDEKLAVFMNTLKLEIAKVAINASSKPSSKSKSGTTTGGKQTIKVTNKKSAIVCVISNKEQPYYDDLVAWLAENFGESKNIDKLQEIAMNSGVEGSANRTPNKVATDVYTSLINDPTPDGESFVVNPEISAYFDTMFQTILKQQTLGASKKVAGSVTEKKPAELAKDPVKPKSSAKNGTGVH